MRAANRLSGSRRRPFAWLVVGLWLLGAPGSVLAGQPVELKPQPTARGEITLGDLFANATEPAAKVVVIHAPPPGLQAVLEASEIQMLAKREGLDWSNVQGLQHIIVASLAGGAPVVRASAAHMSPRQEIRLRAARAPRRDSQALVYARNLAAGEILQATDLQWSSQAVAADDSLDDPALAIGKSARHPVRAGAPVQNYDLANPKLIRAGDAVEVAYENDGVFLTLDGKAMSDAALGDTVEVLNAASKKTIEAVASAPGKALVGPRADALKAAMIAPRLHTAALN
jgi:flagella basal body P-ring formation protein FlgA